MAIPSSPSIPQHNNQPIDKSQAGQSSTLGNIKPASVNKYLSVGEQQGSQPKNTAILDRSAKNVDIANRLSQLKSALNTQHSQNEETASEIKNFDRSIANDKQTIAEAHSQRRSNNSELKHLNQQLQHDKQDISRSEQTLIKIGGKITSADRELKTKEGQKNSLEKMVNQKQDALKKLQAEIAESHTEIKTLHVKHSTTEAAKNKTEDTALAKEEFRNYSAPSKECLS